MREEAQAGSRSKGESGTAEQRQAQKGEDTKSKATRYKIDKIDEVADLNKRKSSSYGQGHSPSLIAATRSNELVCKREFWEGPRQKASHGEICGAKRCRKVGRCPKIRPPTRP